MVAYNKQLQKIVGVNIRDYRKISGKYKIGDKNGKGSEYILYTDSMIFEGEYKNGKRNRKRKDYYHNGDLEFEGEYSNGKRNGKGKEYYYGRKLKFEGEYLNGDKWNGKGYNIEGIIDIQIKDGSGKGKEYDNDGKLTFEGEYLNGKRNEKENNIIKMVN